jgi:hypothetical protein
MYIFCSQLQVPGTSLRTLLRVCHGGGGGGGVESPYKVEIAPRLKSLSGSTTVMKIIINYIITMRSLIM